MQALEIGKNHKFHSCADINIIQQGDISNECYGNGKLGDWMCKCKNFHSGDQCETKNKNILTVKIKIF